MVVATIFSLQQSMAFLETETNIHDFCLSVFKSIENGANSNNGACHFVVELYIIRITSFVVSDSNAFAAEA